MSYQCKSRFVKINAKQIVAILGIACLLIFGSCSGGGDGSSNTDVETSSLKNLAFKNRKYILYKPGNLPVNAPLVFVLHGLGGKADGIMNYSGMNNRADANKFVVCYPWGRDNGEGKNYWDARLDSGDSAGDINYLAELANYLQIQHELDPRRTFVCGHSNGGFMSYTLACEASDVFRAIASVAGTMSGYTWKNRDRASATPILQIHGVDDSAVPLDGSMSSAGGWGGAPAMGIIIDFWADLNNCTMTDTAQISSRTTAYYHTGGVNGNEVWYYQVNNHGHAWPGSTVQMLGEKDYSGINSCKVIWEFFSKFGNENEVGSQQDIDI